MPKYKSFHNYKHAGDDGYDMYCKDPSHNSSKITNLCVQTFKSGEDLMN